jgi:hypothetical protein
MDLGLRLLHEQVGNHVELFLCWVQGLGLGTAALDMPIA